MIFLKFLLILTLYRTCLGAIPAQSSCGVPIISPSIAGATLNRIINGNEATANSWPWQISIRRKVVSGSQTLYSSHLCGGSLIYENIVLTAAHCVDNFAAENIGVVVGVHDFATEPLTSSNTFGVSSRYYHTRYASSPEIINDIAILKLDKNVTLGTKIALACLPTQSDINKVLTKNIVVTGWGSTTGANTVAAIPDQLRQAELLVNNGGGSCTYGYSSATYCAYDNTSPRANACFGDSGGPLVYYENAKWYVYGVVSFVIIFSNGNCNTNLPSFYTQVPAYIPWLETALTWVDGTEIQPLNSAMKLSSLSKIDLALVFSLIGYIVYSNLY